LFSLEKVIGDGKYYAPSSPSKENALTTLTAGSGYWVKVSSDAALGGIGTLPLIRQRQYI